MKHQKPSTVEALNESIDLLVQENFKLKEAFERLKKELEELSVDTEIAQNKEYSHGYSDAKDFYEGCDCE
jgi:regulator of replication initiation timing